MAFLDNTSIRVIVKMLSLTKKANLMKTARFVAMTAGVLCVFSVSLVFAQAADDVMPLDRMVARAQKAIQTASKAVNGSTEPGQDDEFRQDEDYPPTSLESLMEGDDPLAPAK